MLTSPFTIYMLALECLVKIKSRTLRTVNIICLLENTIHYCCEDLLNIKIRVSFDLYIFLWNT